MTNSLVGMGLFWTTAAVEVAARRGWRIESYFSGGKQHMRIVSNWGFVTDELALACVKQDAVYGCPVSAMALAFVNSKNVSLPDHINPTEMFTAGSFAAGVAC